MTDTFLADCLGAAREAARRGAARLQEHAARGIQVREKGRFDLVTDADLDSQQTIRAYLAERFPDHGFLGEEDLASQRRPAPDAAPTWIVDPLDGTTNFVHQLPLYCVSIGLQVQGELVVGAVLEPSRKELFSAARGMGAWVNDSRIQTSRAGSLDEALLATGFPADIRGHEQTLDWWRYFSFQARSLRRTGSTAINLAYVAAGRFDGYWSFDNKVWDVAGGVVIVREAGGIVTDLAGQPFDPYLPPTLASNGPLHPALLQCLTEGP